MIYIAYFILFIGALRLLVAFTNRITNIYLPKNASITNQSFVSILIPARNEEQTIGNLLNDIDKLSYTNYEVLVYNDESTDNTAHLVEQHIASNPKIKLVEGIKLEKGWLGKNFACHQLATKAQGRYLLFLDADVQVANNIIEKTVGLMQRHKLGLLSIFPKQIIKNKEVLLTIPLMNWILLSLLPLVFVRWSSWVSFSAANGQFMLFDADVYKLTQPHATCKASKAEDISICKYLKKRKIKVMTILGNDQIKCTMYTSLDESIDGFSKNIFAFFSDSIVFALLFALLTSFGSLYLLFILGFQVFLAYILSIILIRILVSKCSSQNTALNVLYMPAQHLVFLWIMGVAFLRSRNRSLTWKGRSI
ncbi:MAG: hypothetical protein RL662_2338 [Bacteroidota bacterium]|jgi:glycosyltransferase involved in cell wall biosynthesis